MLNRVCFLVYIVALRLTSVYAQGLVDQMMTDQPEIHVTTATHCVNVWIDDPNKSIYDTTVKPYSICPGTDFPVKQAKIWVTSGFLHRGSETNEPSTDLIAKWQDSFILHVGSTDAIVDDSYCLRESTQGSFQPLGDQCAHQCNPREGVAEANPYYFHPYYVEGSNSDTSSDSLITDAKCDYPDGGYIKKLSQSPSGAVPFVTAYNIQPNTVAEDNPVPNAFNTVNTNVIATSDQTNAGFGNQVVNPQVNADSTNNIPLSSNGDAYSAPTTENTFGQSTGTTFNQDFGQSTWKRANKRARGFRRRVEGWE